MPSARRPEGLPSWGGRYRKRVTAEVLARKGRTCHLCRLPGADTADHLTPRSKGGDDSLANLMPAHHGCNSARGAMTLGQWFAAHPVPRAAALTPSRQW